MRIAYLGMLMALSAALQFGAGMLGSRLYPCKWLGPVIVLCLVAPVVAVVLTEIKRGVKDAGGEDDISALLKGERRIWLTWQGMLTDVMLLGFAVGAAGPGSVHVRMAINIAAGILLSVPLLSFALCWPSTLQPHNRRNELRPNEFPLLCELLREAKIAMGSRRRARLFLGDGTGCAFVGFGYDGIIVSPLFLTALTKEELRQVFLHEFAHLTAAQSRREIRWRRLAARQVYARECVQNGLMRFALVPVICASARFGERLEQYLKCIEPLRERVADERAAVCGEARHAAAAIAKAEFVVRFMEENGVFFRDMTSLRHAYEAKLAQCGQIWLAELMNQEGGDDPHPIFCERMKICGAMQFDPFSREPNAEWLREMGKVCQRADNMEKSR